MLQDYIIESLKILKEDNFKSTLDERVKEYSGDKNFLRFEMIENFLKAVEKKYTIFTHVGIEIENMRGNNISFGPKGPTGNIADSDASFITKMIKSAFLNACAHHFQDKDNIHFCNFSLGGKYLHRGGSTIHMWAIKNNNKPVGFFNLENLFIERVSSDDIQTDEDVDKIMQPFRLMIYQVPDLNKNSIKGSINPLVGKYFRSFVPLGGGGANSIPGWDEVYG
tara:strand:- start:621 stop:1289 length:669 start_codon:yes stop_codon:yes gene_type:complete